MTRMKQVEVVFRGEAEKREAVQSYLLLGNLALTGRVLNIPEITLRQWKASPWWADMVAELKAQENLKLSVKMKEIVEASLNLVQDRIEHGDFVFDQKTGQVVRKPVSLKDAHKVAVDLVDRKDMLEKKAVEPTTDQGTDAKLERLAEKFAEFATKKLTQKLDNERTVDVEDVQEIINDLSGISLSRDAG